MPVVFRYQGFKFFFYSNEGNPLEPAHIHVRSAGKEAKFWLSSEVSLARNDGFDARTIRVLLEVTEKTGKFWRMRGMTISPEKVWFDEDHIWVTLSDGRTIGAPLAWFPRLLRANENTREDFELSVHGIHWDSLDEDISVHGLLSGHGDQTHPKRDNAA